MQNKHYLLVVYGDVYPVLRGPYKTSASRDRAAKRHRRAHGNDDGLFRLDRDRSGSPQVSAFGGAELLEGA
jgi:hypothetical protein